MPITDFNFRPSTTITTFYVVLVALSALIILFLPIGWFWKAVGCAFLLCYGSTIISRYGLLRGAQAIQRMIHQGQGDWLVFTSTGSVTATVRRDSTVTTFLSVLRLQVTGRRWPVSVLVCPDSLAPGVYRQWVVLLKWVTIKNHTANEKGLNGVFKS